MKEGPIVKRERAPETKPRSSIGSYRVEQRQITYRGRVFHFVSYEGPPPASRATWFLMSAGTRWEVGPQVAGEDPEALDQRLLAWVKQTID